MTTDPLAPTREAGVLAVLRYGAWDDAAGKALAALHPRAIIEVPA